MIEEEGEEEEEEAGEHKSFFILLPQSRGMNSVRSLQSHLCSFPVFATPSHLRPPYSRQEQFCVLRRAGAAIQSRVSTVTMAGAAGTDHKVAAHENNGGTEFGAEKIGNKFNKDDGRDENLAAYVFGIDDLRLQPYKLPPVGQTLSLSLSLSNLSFLLLLSKSSYKLLEGCRHHPWRALIIYICSLFWI